MTRDALRPLLSPLAWTLYIAIPVAGWGWLDGLPLGGLETAAIALVWWIWAGERRLPGAVSLAALTVAKLALGAVLVSGGPVARYYANDAWTPPFERSTEFRRSDLTRIDERLAFGADGQPDLPLYFLNNVRWNFYRADEPKRARLPYSIVWEGVIRGDELGAVRTFYLSTPPGATSELRIDGQSIVAVKNGIEGSGSATLPGGWRSISITLAAPYGSGRRFEAGEVIGGSKRPFDARQILTVPASGSRLVIDRIVRWLTHAVDIVVFGGLVVLGIGSGSKAIGGREVGRLLWLVAIAEALWFARPFVDHVQILSGGDDWLMYEHLGRAIIEDPLLKQPGAGAGQGAPFYFQAGYPYFLAVAHLIFGEGLFGVVLVQRLLVAAATFWSASITRRLFGERAGWIALVVGGLFLYSRLGRWSTILLAEPLFTPLLVGWALLLVRNAAETWSPRRVLFTGMLGGGISLIRSTLLMAWPIVVPLWVSSVRRRRYRAGLILLTGMIAVYAVLPLRNWMVSSVFVLTPTNGPPTLYLANAPTRPLAPEPAERRVLYERLKLDSYTRGVLEFAAQYPSEFVKHLGAKLVYIGGFFAASGLQRELVSNTSWLYVAGWGFAVVAAFLLWRSPPAHHWSLIALPGVLALCHLAAHLVFWPNSYGDRMILPIYALLIPYAARGIEPLTILSSQARIRMAWAVLTVLAVAVFLPESDSMSDIIVVLVMVAMVMAVRFYRPASVMFALLLILPLARMGDLDPRHYLILPMAAFAVGQLANSHATRRTILAVLLVGPLVGAAVSGRTVITDASDPVGWARGVAGELGDVRRDVAAVTGGNADARRDLTDDMKTVARDAVRPITDIASVLTNNFDVFSALCLLAIVVHAMRRPVDLLVYAVLFSALAVSLFHGSISVWNGGGYPLAALAILFGLAEARRLSATAT